MVVEADSARLEALHDVSGGQIRGEPTDEVTGLRTARENTEPTARNERLSRRLTSPPRGRPARCARSRCRRRRRATPRIRRRPPPPRRQRVARAKASHLQNELDAATVAHDRLHERKPWPETEARSAAWPARRRAARGGDREGRGEDEGGGGAGTSSDHGRDGAARDGGRASPCSRRRRRAAEQLAKAQRDAMARRRARRGGRQGEEARGRAPAPPQGARAQEAAAAAAAAASATATRTLASARRQAELHGAVIEKVTALEEVERLRPRRRRLERERRHEQLHALRLEHPATVALKRLEEGEAAHVAAQERMQAQLHSAVRERRRRSRRRPPTSPSLHRSSTARGSSGARKAAMRSSRTRARAVDLLRREKICNCVEGEKLQRDAARRGATLSMLSAAGELPADLRSDRLGTALA